ncbi:LOW QUALITY PROTEIN: putative vomeronasal receptor-like protein 4 [Ursus americanus]|uniref:putative vomeronasal receptor-like protein 4 n=1 Tax=Ursus arctos TaxID=9644 RepID=UPI001E67BC57|nr:putative vomeronasal receptor-like protein 4 [Ursus arctos]XP_045659988.1 LOW QUALITY PROTEIN: putative vomeronasal receptor-like protein 4 [Ursus americanus]
MCFYFATMMITLSISITFKICQFLQVGIGVSANTFLLLIRILMLLLDHRPKPTDLTICHLAFVHIMKLFTVLFLLSSDLYESPNVRNDFKCKALFYVGRVMRSLSICTTCLLSVLQAITISPSTSWLAKFKHKCTKYILHFYLIVWLLSVSLSSNLISYTVPSSNVTQTNLLHVSKYCSLSPMNFLIRNLFFTLTISRDVFLVGVMLFVSAYMVMLLSRHRKQCQHLHSSSLSSRVFPERRATQTILLQLSFFVVMYWVDMIISSSTVLLWTHSPLIQDFQTLVVNMYATVSPLVLISCDKRIINMLQKCGKITINFNNFFMK